jgi:hypothetical protein
VNRCLRPNCWWLFLLCIACGGSTTELDGSIGQSLDLSYNDVSVRLIGDELEIRYLRDVEGGGEETTAKLVVELGDEKLAAGLEMILDADNAIVDRVVQDSSSFPEIEQGTLSIDEGGDVGETLAGEFGVTFTTGSTLFGDFSATLEIFEP